MYYQERNDSLVYIIIACFVVIILGVGFAQCDATYSGKNKTVAINEAKQWATEMGLELKGVTCSERDSDNDGYVSCTIVENNDKAEMRTIECVAAYTIGHGCRIPKFQVNTNNR